MKLINTVKEFALSFLLSGTMFTVLAFTYATAKGW